MQGTDVITAKVKGMPELRAKLLVMQAEATAALKAAGIAGAGVIRDEAEQLAPRSANPSNIGHALRGVCSHRPR
jgi:hypothetical protein